MTTLSGLGGIEHGNLVEIERLNQRGGRTLSIVDLVDAGTMDAEMAALCRIMVLNGTSWLTGAVPGGAGKTTIMAALLGFLPPGEPIVTVADAYVLCDAARGRIPRPATLLVHELGAGRWYGYLWGTAACDFLRLAGGGRRCVTCMHADDPGQALAMLAPFGVAAGDLGGIGLQLYIHVARARRGAMRRVRTLYVRLGGRLEPIYRWREDEDRFERLLPRAEVGSRLAREWGARPDGVAAAWDAGEQAVNALRCRGVRGFDDVRRAFLEPGPIGTR
ncbi:MAG: hypothetical protein GXY85_08480 [Candidatus Brocadiaceae bacterium]|nr:hypothetical protein [Candidatus Brocadiaceae bacterium]